MLGDNDGNRRRTLKFWLNLTSSAIRLSISFFMSACFFLRSRSFSFDTKSRNAGTASTAGYNIYRASNVPVNLYLPCASTQASAGRRTLPPAAGAGEGVFGGGVPVAVWVLPTMEPSGAFTATLGTSDLGLRTVVGFMPGLRAPGGTYAFTLRTTAPYL